MRTAKRGERGQALLEFALTAPLLLLMLLGLIEFGHALNSYLVVVSAARDGARLGAKGSDDASIRAMINSETNHLTDAGRPALDANADCSNSGGGVCITPSQGSRTAGGPVTVEVCYDHKMFVGVPGFPNPIHMCSQTTMRIADVSTS